MELLGILMALISFILYVGIWAHTKDTAEALERIEALLVKWDRERSSTKSEP